MQRLLVLFILMFGLPGVLRADDVDAVPQTGAIVIAPVPGGEGDDDAPKVASAAASGIDRVVSDFHAAYNKWRVKIDSCLIRRMQSERVPRTTIDFFLERSNIPITNRTDERLIVACRNSSSGVGGGDVRTNVENKINRYCNCGSASGDNSCASGNEIRKVQFYLDAINDIKEYNNLDGLDPGSRFTELNDNGLWNKGGCPGLWREGMEHAFPATTYRDAETNPEVAKKLFQVEQLIRTFQGLPTTRAADQATAACNAVKRAIEGDIDTVCTEKVKARDWKECGFNGVVDGITLVYTHPDCRAGAPVAVSAAAARANTMIFSDLYTALYLDQRGRNRTDMQKAELVRLGITDSNRAEVTSIYLAALQDLVTNWPRETKIAKDLQQCLVVANTNTSFTPARLASIIGLLERAGRNVGKLAVGGSGRATAPRSWMKSMNTPIWPEDQQDDLVLQLNTNFNDDPFHSTSGANPVNTSTVQLLTQIREENNAIQQELDSIVGFACRNITVTYEKGDIFTTTLPTMPLGSPFPATRSGNPVYVTAVPTNNTGRRTFKHWKCTAGCTSEKEIVLNQTDLKQEFDSAVDSITLTAIWNPLNDDNKEAERRVCIDIGTASASWSDDTLNCTCKNIPAEGNGEATPQYWHWNQTAGTGSCQDEVGSTEVGGSISVNNDESWTNLTVDRTGLSVPEGVTVTYAWARVDGSTTTQLSGNGATYSITDADREKKIRVTVVANGEVTGTSASIDVPAVVVQPVPEPEPGENVCVNCSVKNQQGQVLAVCNANNSVENGGVRYRILTGNDAGYARSISASYTDYIVSMSYCSQMVVVPVSITEVPVGVPLVPEVSELPPEPIQVPTPGPTPGNADVDAFNSLFN